MTRPPSILCVGALLACLWAVVLLAGCTQPAPPPPACGCAGTFERLNRPAASRPADPNAPARPHPSPRHTP